jgi:multimeric flavodoxin WrbA
VGAAPKHVLLVYGGSRGGRTEKLVDAVAGGVRALGADVELRLRPALEGTADDLLWAHGVLLGTPEHFGYMSGALKHFFDRTFYAVEGRTEGLPYALFVTGGTDGTGAVASVGRIVTGYRWKQVAEPVLVRGDATAADLERCRELGATLAAGVAAGLY